MELMSAGKFVEAIPALKDALEIKDAREKLQEAVEMCSRAISAGDHYTVGLKADASISFISQST